MTKVLVGIYETEKTRTEYVVYREVIHVDSNSTRGDNSCDIELYQTACGMTLYFPDESGAMYCAELGDYLVPRISCSDIL